MVDALMENSLQTLQPATNQTGINLACFFLLFLFLFHPVLLRFRGKVLRMLPLGTGKERVKSK